MTTEKNRIHPEGWRDFGDVVVNDPSTNWDGTHLQGYIRSSGFDLIEKLGQPQPGDGYKVFSEWTIESDNGVVTIYDWKGANMLDETVSKWNIGGHGHECWQVLEDAGLEYKRAY